MTCFLFSPVLCYSSGTEFCVNTVFLFLSHPLSLAHDLLFLSVGRELSVLNALKISGFGSIPESMRNLLIQALRKWGSDSVVVTWTWIAEESLEADSIWPARSLHTCFTHADQTDPVCAELTGSKTKTLLVGNSFNGLASLNLLFDHCGLKTLNTPGALSVLSVMEKYVIFLFFIDVKKSTS